jgi:ABC-type lipoprotein export system ATPase subunit
MDDGRICTRGKIWDLHIHSNQCYSVTDKELKQLSITEYVNRLIEVLEDYEDLDMISFTDHDQISFELYRAFYEAKTRIALLPGIEIDVVLDENGPAKHLVIYFDAMNDMTKLENLASKLNLLMREKNVGSGKGKQPIDIHSLLSKLVSFGIHFALSPHAMKQGKRGIDYDWHALPEKERSAEAKKCLDQFFCFWESSGNSEIAHAVEFLKQMDHDELISVVSFSDSKDFEKLREYLDNPCQYFNALPNFNGLKLAGSEITRITRTQDIVNESDLGGYIGTVDFEGQEIRFTPRLNAIIGGRGSGKSVLLDSIACGISPNSGTLHPERRDFIKTRGITVKTMSEVPIVAEQFKIDYFNQSYITTLFEKSGEDFNKEIERQFASGFERIEHIDRTSIEHANVETFVGLTKTFEEQTPENIVGFVDKYIVDTKDSLDMEIGPRKSKVSIGDTKLVSLEYQNMLDDLRAAITSKLPATLVQNQRINAAIIDLQRIVCDEAFIARKAYLEGAFLQNAFVDAFIAKKSSLSKAQAERAKQIELFDSTFQQKSLGIRKRAALVAALIASCDGFVTHYEKSDFAKGENEKAFKFVRELSVEHPLLFMVRTINARKLNLPGAGECNPANLWEYIEAFCFNEDGYRKGSNWEKLYDDLAAYKFNYEEKSSIRFDFGDGVYQDIRELSPGTQTNILIEYIVHKDTRLPLLIDQPEDNIDNQTIYNKIRTWFMGLKQSRQVIVVTHDANIVINADAENVIIAKQPQPGKFVYEYGALEHGNIIEQASLILDGGKDAVKRRLVKYGE